MNTLVKTDTEGRAITTSLIIAEIFQKDHDKVCRDIKNLLCSKEFSIANFGGRDYIDSRGKTQLMYELTRDGFSILVMGYNGEKAFEFKEKFILEFNKRELLLKSDDFIVYRALQIYAKKTKALEVQVQKKEKQIEIQAYTLQIQAPKVEYYNEVLQSKTLILTNVIAKQLGLSAVALNLFLTKKGIIYRSGGTWVLHYKYQDKKYAGTKTYKFTDPEGQERTSIHTYWTEKGRQFIIDLWTNENKEKTIITF